MAAIRRQLNLFGSLSLITSGGTLTGTQSADGKSGPQATKTAAPRGPVTGEVSVEGPKTPETVAKAEPSGVVHVDQVQAPSHGVSVFELPETTAASSSVVVWIDESVGGQQ